MRCLNFEKAMRAQAEDIRKAIDEDKWYLSEKEGHDVGFQFAEFHFLTEHIQRWAERWRKEWCCNKCEMKVHCEKCKEKEQDGNLPSS